MHKKNQTSVVDGIGCLQIWIESYILVNSVLKKNTLNKKNKQEKICRL